MKCFDCLRSACSLSTFPERFYLVEVRVSRLVSVCLKYALIRHFLSELSNTIEKAQRYLEDAEIARIRECAVAWLS